ncbi:hypothetical protein G9A89_009622 [Geosiphon pyriformis]|nr:hypothetical protein G9A89_009622 [Geosiphon pyriformis]
MRPPMNMNSHKTFFPSKVFIRLMEGRRAAYHQRERQTGEKRKGKVIAAHRKFQKMEDTLNHTLLIKVYPKHLQKQLLKRCLGLIRFAYNTVVNWSRHYRFYTKNPLNPSKRISLRFFKHNVLLSKHSPFPPKLLLQKTLGLTSIDRHLRFSSPYPLNKSSDQKFKSAEALNLFRKVKYEIALGIFIYAGFTDLLDGAIARQYNMRTIIGTVMDPAADKILMTVMTVTLTMQDLLPFPLAVLILGRDAALILASLYYRYISLPPPKTLSRYFDFSIPSAEVRPSFISKVNTALQLVLMGFTVTCPALNWTQGPALTALQYTVGGTTIVSGLSYVFSKDAVRILKPPPTQDVRPPWRNWLARSAVNRKDPGSNPGGGGTTL